MYVLSSLLCSSMILCFAGATANVLYTAVFLDDVSRSELLHLWAEDASTRENLGDGVVAEHMTIEFKPSEAHVRNLDIGELVPIVPILWASDNHTCQGVQVISPRIRSTNRYSHVTVSTGEKTGAVCTNDLLKKYHNGTGDILHGTFSSNTTLWGCVDTFPRSGVCQDALARFPPVRRTKETPIDWFRFTDNSTFEQRLFTYETFWNRENGPILMFLGGEGGLEDFYNNSGFLFELAPRLNASVVFLEHRYYGRSLPYGKFSYTNENLAFLTIEQGLADVADVLSRKDDFFGCHPNACRVVLFGGSYGGMLTAWSRLKYPHLSVGALASSAPVDIYPSELPQRERAYMNAMLYTYRTYGSDACADWIEDALERLHERAQTQEGRENISLFFNTCSPLSTTFRAAQLEMYVKGSLSTMAMVDYPYSSSFVTPMPANPVSYACEQVGERPQDADDAWLFGGLASVQNVFVNFTGTLSCLNIDAEMLGRNIDRSVDGLGDITRPWNYQAVRLVSSPFSLSIANSTTLSLVLRRSAQS